MKKVAMVAALSAMLSTPVFAQNFVGASLGTTGGYPDSTGTIVSGLIANGWTSASASQKIAASSLGIYGGQWLSDKLGWEVGYLDSGTADGTGDASFTTKTFNMPYKYSATSIYGAALGAMQVGGGKLYAKAGLHSTDAKSSYSYTNTSTGGAGSASKTNSTAGLLLGVGYEYELTKSWGLRADVTMLNGVQFSDVWNGSTKTQTLTNISIGANYNF